MPEIVVDVGEGVRVGEEEPRDHGALGSGGPCEIPGERSKGRKERDQRRVLPQQRVPGSGGQFTPSSTGSWRLLEDAEPEIGEKTPDGVGPWV